MKGWQIRSGKSLISGGKVDELSRGGVYLARLDPAKGAEVGKLRPVVVLTDQDLLEIKPLHIFICPLSRQSDKNYRALHVPLAARDNLRVQSYALAEHCRSISITRVQSGRLAQLNPDEVKEITRKLKRLIDA